MATRPGFRPSSTRPADGRAPGDAPSRRDSQPGRSDRGSAGPGPRILCPLAAGLAASCRSSPRRAVRSGSSISPPGNNCPPGDLESRSQSYVTALARVGFRGLSSLLEDWILGLIRIWLSAYPEDLDLNFDPATGQAPGPETRGSPDSPVSPAAPARLLRDPGRLDRADRPGHDLRTAGEMVPISRQPRRAGMPGSVAAHSLYEMKAARDCLEHNRGVVNRDYLDKAGAAARICRGRTGPDR